MVLSLEEMKQYLRVDFEDDDSFITNALHSAEGLCADIARLSAEEFSETQTAKIAVMYGWHIFTNTGRTQTTMPLPCPCVPCLRESGGVSSDGDCAFECEDNGAEKYGDGG